MSFSIDPNPPVAGQPCLICANEAEMPIVVVTTVAGQQGEKHNVVKFCFDYTPPANMGGAMLNIHDSSGQLNDLSVQIS